MAGGAVDSWVNLSVSVIPPAARRLVQTFSHPSIGLAKMLPSSRTCDAATWRNVAPDSSRNARPDREDRADYLIVFCLHVLASHPAGRP